MPRRCLAAFLVAAGLSVGGLPAQASAQGERLLETMTIALPPYPHQRGQFGDTISETVFRAGATYRLVVSGLLTVTPDDGSGYTRYDPVYCVETTADYPCSHTRSLPVDTYRAPGEELINRYFWDLNNPPSFEAQAAAPTYSATHSYEVMYTPQRSGRLTGRSTSVISSGVRESGGFTVEIYGTPVAGPCHAAIARTQRVLANRGVKLTVGCPAEATIVAAARLGRKSVGHVEGLAPEGGAIALKIKLTRAGRALVRRRLAAGRPAVLTVTVTAIDANSGDILGASRVKVRVE